MGTDERLHRGSCAELVKNRSVGESAIGNFAAAYRQCPSCDTFIQKGMVIMANGEERDAACMHMTCGCGYEFDWWTGVQWESPWKRYISDSGALVIRMKYGHAHNNQIEHFRLEEWNEMRRHSSYQQGYFEFLNHHDESLQRFKNWYKFVTYGGEFDRVEDTKKLSDGESGRHTGPTRAPDSSVGYLDLRRYFANGANNRDHEHHIERMPARGAEPSRFGWAFNWFRPGVVRYRQRR